VVFDNAADLAQRIDSDDLDVQASDVRGAQDIGPWGGAPGMPEAGYIRSRASSRGRREGHRGASPMAA
jgi:dihydroxy-acid dehydratase